MHGYVGWLGELRGREPPLAPFHWEIEFPEVFDRENPGFDAVVGNPPFAGKSTVAAANVAGYPDWLKQVHAESHGNADLVAPALFAAIDGLEQVLVISRVGQQASFTFSSASMVYAETTVVFPSTSYSALCVLQSRHHEIRARFFGSSLEDRLRYTPSDCFETFPFPDGWGTHPVLETAGKTYYEHRAALMVRNDEGMTKSYNRFHDPDETAPDIARLRNLHATMDRAVLDAYGWTDIPTDCEFLLDYETDEEDRGTRKKPYRYRWPDEVRDEVLARLLELNAARSAEEQRSGSVTGTANSGVRSRRLRGPAAGDAPATVPAPRTLWDDAPLDGAHAGGNPDGIET